MAEKAAIDSGKTKFADDTAKADATRTADQRIEQARTDLKDAGPAKYTQPSRLCVIT